MRTFRPCPGVRYAMAYPTEFGSHTDESSRDFQMHAIAIVILCIVSAVIYGILHDQVTARV